MGSNSTNNLVQDGSLGADFISNVFNCDSYALITLHYWISAGTPSGALKVQVSNFEDLITDGYLAGNPSLPKGFSSYITKWVDLKDVVNFPTANAYDETTIASGVPAAGMVQMDLAGWRWMRIVFTHSGGTGTLQARVKGKRLSPANR